MSASDFISAARARLKKPFRHQGRGPEHYDCAGLLVASAREAGYAVEDRTDYPATPNGELQPQLALNCDRVTGPWQPGDILLMRFVNEPQHLALWTGETVVHSYAKVGRVVEHGLDDKWRRRVVSVWRLRGAS